VAVSRFGVEPLAGKNRQLRMHVYEPAEEPPSRPKIELS
jgi:hypothetical protein